MKQISLCIQKNQHKPVYLMLSRATFCNPGSESCTLSTYNSSCSFSAKSSSDLMNQKHKQLSICTNKSHPIIKTLFREHNAPIVCTSFSPITAKQAESKCHETINTTHLSKKINKQIKPPINVSHLKKITRITQYQAQHTYYPPF